MNAEGVLTVLSGLLTPLIAIVATYIAWQQWRTNQFKLALDKYERRLRVYEAVRDYLGQILRDANIDTTALAHFRNSVWEADFLFGAEITTYIDELHRRGNLLRYWNAEYRDYTQPVPPGYDHNKVVDGMHVELIWFAEQPDVAKEKFKRFLDISE